MRSCWPPFVALLAGAIPLFRLSPVGKLAHGSGAGVEIKGITRSADSVTACGSSLLQSPDKVSAATVVKKAFSRMMPKSECSSLTDWHLLQGWCASKEG